MPSIDEIASWYQEDDRFDRTRSIGPVEDDCVRRSEESAKAEGWEATFADALIALKTGQLLRDQGVEVN